MPVRCVLYRGPRFAPPALLSWPRRRVSCHGLAGVVLALALGGCTVRAPWAGEGLEGNACFPDQTCDPGLRCVNARCTRNGSASDGGGSGDGGVSDLYTVDQPPGCTGTTVPTPTLEPVAPSTQHLRVAVSGRARGARELEVRGGGKTVRMTLAGERFCLEVDLQPGVTNSFLVVAVSDRGCTSQPANFSIVQQPTTSPNRLLGKRPESNVVPDKPLTRLTDGLYDQSVRLSFFDADPPGSAVCNDYAYLWFRVSNELQTIDQVTVRYPSRGNFSSYATCWTLLGSELKDPPAPNPSLPDWAVLAKATTTSSGTLTIPVPSAKVRHLALLLFEDGGSGVYETFELTEVEARGGGDLPPYQGCK
ncbi:MAG: hypothetical protein IT371_14940 [Deltaproteobacteria bacterium]|nr:hypothetical protein [Deltaproteobacteria bacterium]